MIAVCKPSQCPVAIKLEGNLNSHEVIMLLLPASLSDPTISAFDVISLRKQI